MKVVIKNKSESKITFKDAPAGWYVDMSGDYIHKYGDENRVYGGPPDTNSVCLYVNGSGKDDPALYPYRCDPAALLIPVDVTITIDRP